MRVALGLIGIGLIAALVWWFWPSTEKTVVSNNDSYEINHTTSSTAPTTEAQVASDWVPPVITYDSYESKHGSLPPSLEGTRIPFFLQVTEQGELIVNDSLRRMFDYFFTTDGEEPFETIIARIEELLEAHLPEPARSRAIEILHQYIAVKNGEIEIAKQMDMDFRASGERPDLLEMKRLLRDLRASNLDPEVYAAFYGAENQRDEYTLNRLEIQKDTSLTDEERAAALEAIEEYLPEQDRLHMQEERHTQQTYLDVEQARLEGASDAEIFNIRAQAFGAEAAQRYADADKKKFEWDSRISTYRQIRQEILETPGLTEDDKEYQIEQLRNEHFEGNELKRIPVIDRMRDAEGQ